VLTLLIQVVLEGWGITHYRMMSEACKDPCLKATFQAILRDEAFHHGTGNVLFSRTKLSEGEERYVIAFLTRLLEMVRVGPQSVVSRLVEGLGGLSLAERVEVFRQLETERTTREKLTLLRGLLEKHHLDGVLSALDENGAFSPFSPEVCARVSANDDAST